MEGQDKEWVHWGQPRADNNRQDEGTPTLWFYHVTQRSQEDLFRPILERQDGRSTEPVRVL